MRWQSLGRFLQPAGFAGFLAYFLIPETQIATPLVVVSAACIALGIAWEIWNAEKVLRPKGDLNSRLFYGNAVIKFLLLLSILYRMAERPYSLWVLLIVLLIALIWNAILYATKPDQSSAKNSDLLDH
ncbi:MAG: hypothetical protein JNK73_02860 [Bacteroidia bacterium]|nr:hypothetical protein [Bacteroidia bacterium]